jgi:hypothetical protein
MPTICEASLTRKFNLGNYESVEVGLKAFVGEGEDPLQVLAKLEYNINKYIQTSHPEATPQTSPQQPSPQQLQPSQPIPQSQVEKLQTVDDVKKNFPEDMQSLLNFEETQDLIIIKPKAFLGSENFAKVAQIVRRIGGDYVSAGKESHFRVPRKKV